MARARIGQGIKYACGQGVNCTKCTRTDLHVQGSWIFNEFFHQHIQSGNAACDFSGAGKLSWPTGSKCRPGLQDEEWCLPKAGTPSAALTTHLQWICSDGGVDCSDINGGECVFPKTADVMYKSEWAYNTYFQKNGATKMSCAFEGSGEVMSSKCSLSPDQLTWCRAKSGASKDKIGEALAYVCGDGGVLCDRCHNEANKVDWALNDYFQQAWSTAGAQACDFKGIGELSWPPSSPCRPSKKDEKWCLPKEGLSKEKLTAGLEYVCSEDPTLCQFVKPGGGCVFPEANDLEYKVEVLFNNYYQKFKSVTGESACDFGGNARVVPAGNRSNTIIQI